MILQGNAFYIPIKNRSVQCVVTSPPYWGLRDYGVPEQLGLERTPEKYVANIAAVFAEVWRVLRDDGTVWLNLGDSYANPGHYKGNPGDGIAGAGHRASEGNYRKDCDGLKNKDLVGIPWRVAFALQAAGWYLRSDIIWSKPNPMPESVTDRPTKAHEYIFLLAKSERYYFDQKAVQVQATQSSLDRWNQDIENQIGSTRVPGKTNGNMKAVGFKPSGTYGHGAGRNDGDNHPSGGWCDSQFRNIRTVWEIATQPYKGAHFATFPKDLIKPCIFAGAPAGGIVLDPFVGSGTTVEVAQDLGRIGIGLDLKWEYLQLGKRRAAQQGLRL